MQAEFQVGDRVRFWNFNQTHRLVGKILFLNQNGTAGFIRPEGDWQDCWRFAKDLEPAEEGDVCDSPAGRYGPTYIRLHQRPAPAAKPPATPA